MDILSRIAERKISQAIEDGSLDFARWKNMPLPADDDMQVPDDLKIAYKMLKNAGYLPPEIEAKKEIRQLEEMIARTEDEHVRLKQMKKLNLLLMKMEATRQSPTNLAAQDHYYNKIVERISVNCRKDGR
ncbi:MAG: DnaJ family domain-containing protein [Thermodesulfobacteriota bacterium]